MCYMKHAEQTDVILPVFETAGFTPILRQWEYSTCLLYGCET